jgi:hypothetical protein
VEKEHAEFDTPDQKGAIGKDMLTNWFRIKTVYATSVFDQ